MALVSVTDAAAAQAAPPASTPLAGGAGTFDTEHGTRPSQTPRRQSTMTTTNSNRYPVLNSNRTVDVVSPGYPYPFVTAAEDVTQCCHVGEFEPSCQDCATDAPGDIIEVRVITTTVHRVTRRALEEVSANADDGVRGNSALGLLLAEHRDRIGGPHVEAVEVVPPKSENGNGTRTVDGWEYRAQAVADRAVGELARLDLPHLGAWHIARAVAVEAERLGQGLTPEDAAARAILARHDFDRDAAITAAVEAAVARRTARRA